MTLQNDVAGPNNVVCRRHNLRLLCHKSLHVVLDNITDSVDLYFSTSEHQILIAKSVIKYITQTLLYKTNI